MQLSDPENRLLLACFEASRAWFQSGKKHESEKAHSDRIRYNVRITEQQLKRFLVTWKVARNANKDKRQELCEALTSIADRYQNLCAISSPGFVLDLDNLNNTGTAYGRPVSLVSKYLFCNMPEVFAPYDQYARRALIALGAEIEIANYAQFMRSFELFHAKVAQSLIERGLTSEFFAFEGAEPMHEKLFSRRVADKYLMLIGGYGDQKFIESIQTNLTSFSGNARQTFEASTT